jgi:hypothetical protein
MDKNHFVSKSSNSRKFLDFDGVSPDEAYLAKKDKINNNNNDNKDKKTRKQATRRKPSKNINTDHFSRNDNSSGLRTSVSSDKLLQKRDNDNVSSSSSNNNNIATIRIGEDNDQDDYGNNSCTTCFPKGIKTENIIRLFNVIGAFPFVIVVASLNLSSKYETFLRSVIVIRIMNMLMLILPYFLVKNILAELIDNPNIQILVIAAYIAIYLFPVAFVIFTKFSYSSLTSIEEGTFCFKPSRTARLTWANFFAIVGFIGEWVLLLFLLLYYNYNYYCYYYYY